MKKPISLVLPKPKTGQPQTALDDTSQASIKPDSASSKPGDIKDSKLHGTVTKSWTSGGLGGKGALKAKIVATYPVVKDPDTGVADLASDSFSLAITDVDHKITSNIAPYLFSDTNWKQIPTPDEGGAYAVNGKVKIDLQASGRFLRVDFDMSGGADVDSGSTPRDIGYIFLLDIPGDTVFTAQDASSA